MRNYAICAIVSAAVGAALFEVGRYASIDSPAAAQQAPQPARPSSTLAWRDAGPVAAAGEFAMGEEGYLPDEQAAIHVYENVNRSVVNINTLNVRPDFLFLESSSEGMGSGVVLSHEGHILTNFHVVENARVIEVSLFDGSKHSAKLVGRDPFNDLAVIRIEAPAELLFPVMLGDSSRLRVGQRVFAIGNPFGLERTLTTGVISSLNRSIPTRNQRTIRSMIQIDAAINPGNSGGPLLDSRGRMIGLNMAIASNTGQNTGVGFAIPVSIVSRVAPQLIENGHVVRADAGVERVLETEQGLLVTKLTPDGPAERAGVRGPAVTRETRRSGPFVYENRQVDRSKADLIVGVDGTSVQGASEFISLIETKRPGEQAVLDVIREGKRVAIPLTLGEAK